MDPLAHTLVGAALASSRLGRRAPHATVTMTLAANAPDIDVLAYFGGSDTALLVRRGITHGPLGLLVLPAVLLALVAFSSWRRRDPRPVEWRRLAALAYLAALTHPVLDWLNTYGIRLLAPFSDRWYYGDTLFIVDPWLWLLLGGGLFLAHSGNRRAIVGWVVLATLASLLILAGPVGAGAKLLWFGGLVAIAAARLWAGDALRRDGARTVAIAITAAGLYLAAMLGSAWTARGLVRRELERLGIGPVREVMVGPLPATPFEREVVVELGDHYRFGSVRFLPAPRVEWIAGAEGRRPKRTEDPVGRSALEDPAIRGFVGWARFPYVVVEEASGGERAWVLDARYARELPSGGEGAFGAVLARKGVHDR